MECNRDEALRAREIAESKFKARDIEGAKRLALKAQTLYPGLEGIPQMIATLDVYLSAQLVINGEKDWYSILCVSTSADEETVKKQYRKLALMLHPTRTKAWSVLSDKSRRLAYDKKRNIKVYKQRPPLNPKRDPSTASHSSTNGFFHFSSHATSNVRAQKGAARVAPPVIPHPNTFWTVCNRCKMQYEYLRVYLNHNLLCPNCHEPFLAIEIPIPMNGCNTSNPWATQQQQQQQQSSNVCNGGKNARKGASTVPGMRSNGFHQGSNCDPHSNPNFQWGAFSRTAGAASAAASFSAAAQSVNVVHQAYEKVRKERKEAEAAEQRREEHLQRRKHIPNASFHSNIPNCEQHNSIKADRPAKKRRSAVDDSGTNHRGDEYNGAGHYETERASNVSADPGKTRPTARQGGICGLGRELLQTEIRSVLLQKAKSVIQKKLEELNSAPASKLTEKEKAKPRRKLKDGEKEKENAEVPFDVSTDKELEEISDERAHDKTATSGNVSAETDEQTQVPILSINVPDPDFHDFDGDRSEQSFQADQVWATYDDEDGMPRFYAMVQKVLSLKPFKIRLSFLNSKTTTEFSLLNWVGSGFTKTCGDFRVGRYEIQDTVNIFSHQVRWEKGLIWALYRNWSPDWNEHTLDEIIYKYDMVEVLEDFSEQGVLIAPLVKVAGFKTVFRRHLDPKEVRRIPKEETFRFSHQVPYYTLSGEEAKNAPQGCFELDPAATPLELLQVTTEGEGLAAMAKPPASALEPRRIAPMPAFLCDD
ncbi:unnamed protein product [Spirodela intermedia]|uniref:J domain-containing protein n=1 Tax=Spirodela intermedia TaxID=51605 RepID=A0A7I8JCZ3_SPIIN|nr:unnamed protein product [Spirodela intermedia]CAA6667861.1 unnamed protein product [Spirodela intermedia]